MGNLKKLTDELNKFFALVELHESHIQNWIQEAKKPLHSIINQSVFYRAVVPQNSVINTPFEHIEGFREALIENLFASLQEEYNRLEQVRDNINSANEKLQKEQIFIENLFLDLISKGSLDDSNLNPCCPSLEHIIEWSHNIWCYYHSYYLQISQALLKLNYESETTVKCLIESFTENSELKKQISRIRNFKFSEFEFLV